MTTRGSRLSSAALRAIDDGPTLERRRIPISLCVAGTAVAMNLLAAVLSLLALSVS
ncbi:MULTISPECIES: hypothetical protein [Microvirga]|uniref:hypothetical protein n=1 Tax=Microvirga TaxID=186650 RepID=UPI0021CA7B20|nr:MULTISPECIES: hypothetical protein [unclassified Microvirga]